MSSRELDELEQWQREHPDSTDEEFDDMLTERGYADAQPSGRSAIDVILNYAQHLQTRALYIYDDRRNPIAQIRECPAAPREPERNRDMQCPTALYIVAWAAFNRYGMIDIVTECRPFQGNTVSEAQLHFSHEGIQKFPPNAGYSGHVTASEYLGGNAVLWAFPDLNRDYSKEYPYVLDYGFQVQVEAAKKESTIRLIILNSMLLGAGILSSARETAEACLPSNFPVSNGWSGWAFQLLYLNQFEIVHSLVMSGCHKMRPSV